MNGMMKIASAVFFVLATGEDTVEVPQCAPTGAYEQYITQQYNEAPAFVGKHIDSGLVTILAINPTTRTWSILMQDRDSHITCVLSVGDQFTFPSSRQPVPAP